MASPPTFWRSPRLRRALPTDKIEIPPPPSDPANESGWGNIVTMILPGLLMATVMVVIGFAMKTSNWLIFSIPILLVSTLASVISYVYQQRRTRERTARRSATYRQILDQTRQRLIKLQEAQQQLRMIDNPTPEECLRRVSEKDRSLWGRASNDPDFLEIRVGMGLLPSTVEVRPPNTRDAVEHDPLMDSAQGLAREFAMVSNVPITFSMDKAGVTGIVGHKPDMAATTRAILVQLATHHGPDEIKFAMFYDKREGWDWMRWLPHTWSDDHKRRYLADQPDSMHRLAILLDETLDARRNQREMSEKKDLRFLPAIIVFITDIGLIQQEPLLNRLQYDGPSLGIYPVFLADRVKSLPATCRISVRVGSDQPMLIASFSTIETTPFIPDKVGEDFMRRLAGAMAPIRLQRTASRQIPASVTLMELYGVHRMEELNVLEQWRKSEHLTRTLAVKLGVGAGGEAVVLDLHERKHGPNGLVAGMVGAGKSELLQTLVASIAINYHPHKVAFVLIDYKGGGMADPFVKLPHTLGVITNLQQGNLATRALTSFRVELNRRMTLFGEAGVNHIDDYQRKYYANEVKEALPYLVVIVDEFAEMKTEQPEVAREFVKIARLGRAPGLFLLLAMQKPSGIVDGQIEGNTRFRLCLRVASTEDSQAMLKRPDAAMLVGTGRAYLQVGANEIFEEFQVAWSGAPYDPSGLLSEDPKAIATVGLDGTREVIFEPSKESLILSKDKTQLKALAEDYLPDLATKAGLHRLRPIWLDLLPETITLDDLLGRQPNTGWDGSYWHPTEDWINPGVGLYDDPTTQQQGVLSFDLGRKSHMIVYGAPRTGKTTLVQSLIVSLARTHTPDEVHLYIMDFGGRVLKLFEELPHVGAVVTADEAERVERLMQFLVKELDRRRELFGSARIGNLIEYRRAFPNSLPAIVVVLDNYANFVEDYESQDDVLLQLIREGGGYGIHFVLTASDLTTVRFKLTSNILLAAALQMVDESDYAAIVGRTEGLKPAPVLGRGVVRADPPLEFQTALPSAGANDAERVEKLQVLLASMREAWNGPLPTTIDVLPDHVALHPLLDGMTEHLVSGRLVAPLGLIVKTLKPLVIDLAETPSLLLAGLPGSGKTNLLRTWIIALAAQYTEEEVQFYILDSSQQGLEELQRLPQTKVYSSTAQDSLPQIENLLKIIQHRRSYRQSQRNGAQSSLGAQGQSTPDLAWIVVVIDDLYHPFFDGTSEESKARLMEVMSQGRGVNVSVLLCGPLEHMKGKTWSDPVKTLQATQTGFVLGSSEDSLLPLHLPYAERDKVLPAGEGYWVHKGRSTRVKTAFADFNQIVPKVSLNLMESSPPLEER